MIKIRYAELPTGLHVRAEVEGKSTVIYLLPGLTPVQRRDALARARSSARLGYGPELPWSGVAAAVAVDRIHTTLRNGLAALRAHPLFFVPPMALMVSAVLVCVLLASLNISVGPLGTGHGAGAYFGLPHFWTGGGVQPRPAASSLSRRPRPATRGTGSARPVSGFSAPAPQYPAAPGPTPSPDPSPDPSPSGSSSPPSGSTSPPGSSPPASTSPTPTQSAMPGCLKVDKLVVCVHV